jgi:rhodanese-related sulfurtransferase
MKVNKIMLSIALAATVATSGAVMAGKKTAKITPSMESVQVKHNGKDITIRREGDDLKSGPYSKTVRGCPPFCIQPMQVVPGVETIGELEVLGYLKRMSNGDLTVLVVDSRTPDWVRRGTIPGSVNIPWNKINVDVAGAFEIDAEAETMTEILTSRLGARMVNGEWDFRTAKTLVMFCNGSWCPQSSINIKTLAKLGYPAYKLKWYRGGMQDWVSLGLTTIKH